MSKVPIPTPIYRIIHIDNLHVCLRRGTLYAPNHCPDNGLEYKTIHNVQVQDKRRITAVGCGPGGSVHDYVAFYFGPRSPMLYQLHTGWVSGYREGQDPLIYLVSTAQEVERAGYCYVFSDGHGIAHFTSWYDNLDQLDEVDWEAVCAKWWKDTHDDPDRQRRKQAEFLVHEKVDWGLVSEIGVHSEAIGARVEKILADEMASHRPTGHIGPPCVSADRPIVKLATEWYYEG